MLKFFDNDRTFFDMSKAEVSLAIFRQRHVATVFNNHNFDEHKKKEAIYL